MNATDYTTLEWHLATRRQTIISAAMTSHSGRGIVVVFNAPDETYRVIPFVMGAHRGIDLGEMSSATPIEYAMRDLADYVVDYVAA